MQGMSRAAGLRVGVPGAAAASLCAAAARASAFGA
jgi:hypothetical protein